MTHEATSSAEISTNVRALPASVVALRPALRLGSTLAPEAAPRSGRVLTEDLGNNRILNDPRVIGHSVAFIAGTEAGMPA